MDINPIPYSAFVKEDNSIQKLIDQLTELQNTYLSLLKTVKSDAGALKTSLSGVNAATHEGQKAVNEASLGAQRLKRLQEELALALSETGQEIAKYKVKLADATETNKLTATQTLASAKSVKQLKAELATLIKQYEGLSGETRVYDATTQELINNIKNLRASVKEATDAIALKTAATQKQVTANNAIEAATKKLIGAYSNEIDELYRIKRETDEVLKIKRLEARAAEGTTRSYNALAAQYELNMINLNKYSQEVINSSRFLSRQQEESKKLRFEMMRLKEATGNHTLSVGNYTKAWNGLGMATQQVVRELPAMAVSAQTFFIAISNNIPILADEIKNLVQQNKVAASQGLATVSVIKQIVRSFLSWQTALVLGLTALSLFGGELIKLIKSIGAADKATMSLAKAQETVNKIYADADETYADTIVKYRVLREQWLNLSDSLDERTRFIEDNADAFTELGISIEDVNDAENIFVNNSAAVIRVLELRAKAAAARNLAEKEFALEVERAAKEQAKIDETLKKRTNIPTPVGTATIDYRPAQIDSAAFDKFKQSVNSVYQTITDEQLEASKSAFQRQGEQYIDLMSQYMKEAEAVAAAAGIKPSKDKTKPDKDTTRDTTENLLAIERENLEIRKLYAESITNLERDELEKQKKQLKDTFDAEVAELRNKQRNEEKLTEESRKLIDDIIYNKRKKLNTDLELLDIDYQQRQLNFEKEGLDLRLELTERGTVEYYELRNKLLQNQMEYELLENRKQIESLRKDEQAIRDKYGYDMLQNKIALDDMLFSQTQAYQESEFNLIRRSEYEKNRFRLQQEKEMWTRRLQMAKAGLLAISKTEQDTIENTIKIIERQMRDLDAERDIYDLIGLRLDNEQKSAIQEATSFVKANISDMLAAEVQLAETKLDNARSQVEQAMEFLKLEMEARNEGYAHNVETANKELQLAREKEAKALKDRQKALEAQNKLDTIEQTTSLITASANIWKSFSKLGPFGVGAAIAAIALMFGSFVAAKAKAKEVSTVETEEYAEGHVELLEGGSHKSGNDIPLGRTKDGKERRAEGGEVFAIVNKRSVRRYGKDKVFDIVSSINKGVFEDKYTKIFSPINYEVSNSSTNIDLYDLDLNVKAIREQNEYKYYNGGNGLIIERYKNRTRVFKK